MKIKTNRFAVAAAILLALCLVFVAPVVAADVAKIGDTGYETLESAIESVTTSEPTEIVILATEGTPLTANIEIPGGKNITLRGATGNPADIVLNGQIATLSSDYGTLTIKDLTIDVDSNIVDSTGISQTGKSAIALWGNQKVTCENVVFNMSLSDSTAITGWWDTDIGTEIVVKNCVFDCNGQRPIRSCGHVTVENSVFNDPYRYVVQLTAKASTATLMDKAIINFKNNVINNGANGKAFVYGIQLEGGDYGCHDVIINGEGNILNAGSWDTNSESTMYYCECGKVDHATITWNAETEAAHEKAVAKIGQVAYNTLAEAVEKAKAGETVTLLKDVTISENPLTVDKSITIDGNGHALTRTDDKGSVICLKNNTDGVTLDVTLQNFKEISGKYAVYLGSKSDLEVKASTLKGYGALYLNKRVGDGDDASSSKVTILNSELIGVNRAPAGTSSDFGTIVIQANDTVVDVQNSKLVAKATGTANQSILRFGADSATSPFENAKVTIGGNSVLEVSNANFMSVGTGSDFTGISQQIIGAGVTANFNPSAYIASGMEVVQPGDKYLVQKYVDRSSSSSSSSSTTEPEEPEQPEEPVVEPETPAAPGEATVETEVTDGGEVELETPAAEGEGGSAAADEDEAKITGVVLPTGTDSEVAFVPVSEQPAPAGQEENTKKVFEINVPTYEKGKAAVIKFQMTVEELAADGKEAADVALWHFDEETGEWTKLVTSYTIVDGVVYFEAITEDFSPFAIIYEDEPVDEPVEEPETPASPAPVLGLLAALGAAVVLRRK